MRSIELVFNREADCSRLCQYYRYRRRGVVFISENGGRHCAGLVEDISDEQAVLQPMRRVNRQVEVCNVVRSEFVKRTDRGAKARVTFAHPTVGHVQRYRGIVNHVEVI